MPVNVNPADLPTISPTQAAKELRIGIRHVLNHWNSGAGSTMPLKKSVRAYDERRQMVASKVDGKFLELEAALAARRTKEAREHLSSLASSLSAERHYSHHAIQAVRELPENLGVGGLQRTTLERWNHLVQCLPTVEDIPQGREQNVIRAIIAILRANNMGDLGAMTQVVQDQEGAVNGESKEATG